MALKYFAYIYLSLGFSPEHNTVVSENEYSKFKAVGLSLLDKEKVVEVAKNLHAEGVQMLELCGGFGPLWIAKVSEALNYAIPVGSTAYGPEGRQSMLDIMKNTPKL